MIEGSTNARGSLFFSPMADPSDHLLRTFGALPVGSRVLDLGCGHGLHTGPFVRLGFDVYACDTSPEVIDGLRASLAKDLGPDEAGKRVTISRVDALGYPDNYFDWVVAFDVLQRMETRKEILDVLDEAHRVIRPGGWLYVAVPALPDHTAERAEKGYAGDSRLEPIFTPRTLDELLVEAGYQVAERSSTAVENGQRIVRAIYRRVEPGTPV